VVDVEKVPVGSGQFIAVAADSARHIRAGDSDLVFSAVCAAQASADGFHGTA
jgi:hypothetical protein